MWPRAAQYNLAGRGLETNVLAHAVTEAAIRFQHSVIQCVHRTALRVEAADT